MWRLKQTHEQTAGEGTKQTQINEMSNIACLENRWNAFEGGSTNRDNQINKWKCKRLRET